MHSSNDEYPPASAPPQYATGVPLQTMTSTSQWSSGLCDCTNDVSNCCLTCWCPCIPFERIVDIVDKGTTSNSVHGTLYTLLLFAGCQCIFAYKYRTKIRQQYMLPEEPCNDCLVHCCCDPCATCQEYRELQYRGFDMPLGWHGNMEKQNRGIVMPPIGPGGMQR